MMLKKCCFYRYLVAFVTQRLALAGGHVSITAALLLLPATSYTQEGSLLPDYQRVGGISGNLSSIGSDTLANLMTLWAEAFNRLYTNVHIQIQASGSSTAPPALTEGTANLGPMSRAMKSNEIEGFESKFGYEPTAIPVAIDALAIFVNEYNLCYRADSTAAGRDIFYHTAVWVSGANKHLGAVATGGSLAKSRHTIIWPELCIWHLWLF